MLEFFTDAVRQSGGFVASIGRSAMHEMGQTKAVESADDGAQDVLRKKISGNLVEICFLHLEADERKTLESDTARLLQTLHNHGGSFLPPGPEEFAVVGKLHSPSLTATDSPHIPFPRQVE